MRRGAHVAQVASTLANQIDHAAWEFIDVVEPDGIEWFIKYDDDRRKVVRGLPRYTGTGGDHMRPPESGELLVSYEEYLASPVWRRTRELVLGREGRYCHVRGCGSTFDVQVHHRDGKAYSRLGWEWWEDLIPICKACHDLLHRALREPWTLTGFEALRFA